MSSPERFNNHTYDEFQRKAEALERAKHHSAQLESIDRRAAAKPPMSEREMYMEGAILMGGIGVFPPTTTEYIQRGMGKLFHKLGLIMSNYVATGPSTIMGDILMHEIEAERRPGGEIHLSDPLT